MGLADQLSSYKKHLLVGSILSGSLVALVGLSIFTISHLIIEVNLEQSLGLAGLMAVALGALCGYWLYKSLTFGFDFLAQAILHSTSTSGAIDPPDHASLSKSQGFLGNLAESTYDTTPTVMPAASQVQKIAVSDSTTNPIVQGDIPSLAQLNVPAVAIKADDTIAYANAAAGVYFGFSPETTIGQPAVDHLHLSFQTSGDTLSSWMADSRQNRVQGSKSWDRVKASFGDDGLRQFDMVARYSKSGSDYDTLLVFMDHTDRYAQEDMDISFVAMAVHELRTPLTTMRGYIEVFQDELSDQLNEEQATFMRNMGAQAHQLADFVSNILNVARIEENQLHLHLREEDWPSVLSKTIAEMELRARVHGMSISYSQETPLPSVGIDKVTMYEVMVNLLDNAIKYTHTNSTIEVRTVVKDDTWIETTVTDKGVGIPDNIMGSLFQKFYRSHKSNKTAGGTGLGLYLSRAIVNAHGGEIWVKSEEGKGSTFGFTIPTYESIAKDLDQTDNKEITREAHGWIKNHSLYRG